ncbi:hypothetical protein C8F01DRAFT_1253960 [Mycena amicta]|nr:hypothetical protein C8F01DRAFT_1253960 [Mycena amicta]
MSGRHSLGFVLNPGPPPYFDVKDELRRLASFAENDAVLVPATVRENLVAALHHLDLSVQSPNNLIQSQASVHQQAPTIRYKVAISSRTTLSVLYEHPIGAVVEYPETSASPNEPVGHLFHMDLKNWSCPSLDIAYSRGEPNGQSKQDCDLLLDRAGNRVRCIMKSSTCQGIKICPNIDESTVTYSEPHTKATRQDILERLKRDAEERARYSSPSRDVFERTQALLSAVRRTGCRRPKVEDTKLSEIEQLIREQHEQYLSIAQRGYSPSEEICRGRIIFKDGSVEGGKACIQCEHYDADTNKDHFHDTSVGNGSYNLQYIEAVLWEDEDKYTRIELEMLARECGPLLPSCSTVANCTSQKSTCAYDHRDESGALTQPLLQRVECLSRYRVYEPVEEDRDACPFILLVAIGPHRHIPPLPLRTPAKIRRQFLELAEELREDLPDITARGFMRHPIVKNFLRVKFPELSAPTLSDWHISLANRSHLESYLKIAIDTHYPFQTGWRGVKLLMAREEDQPVDKQQRYIRRMLVKSTSPAHEEEETSDSLQPKKVEDLRVVVCMTPQASRRLLNVGQYLQCDIGFKRIVDYYEFELACMDREANTSAIFARVYVNQQSAQAHFLVFKTIHEIVLQDTGDVLEWQHIHGSDDEKSWEGRILSVTVDQHRGQALGLGLYLQWLAQQMPQTMDLHEPWRTIQSLDPYEHLRHCMRLCTLHLYRNIKTSKVTDEVRWKMRSLICVEHDDWDGTVEAKAGDQTSNLIETAHRDVNREGVHCSLVGGLQKGFAFDMMKLKTLQAYQEYGVNPSYRSTHIAENAFINLKRRDYAQHRRLISDDAKIENYNAQLNRAYETIQRGHAALLEARVQQANAIGVVENQRQKLEAAVQRKELALAKGRNTFEKLAGAAESLKKLGSKKVAVLEYDITEFRP